MAMSDPAEPGEDLMARRREFDEEVVLYAASHVFGRAAMKIGTALTSLDGPYHTRQVTDAHWRRRPAEDDANPPPSGPSNPSLIRHLRDSVLRRRIGDRESCNPFALSSEEAHRDIFRGVTMAKRRELLGMTVLAGAGLFSLWPRHRAAKAAQAAVFPVMHTDADWRSLLSPAAYNVLRREGTETPFSSKLDFETRAGTYACAGCDLPVFSSETKFDSHTGWPSFWQPLSHAVAESGDTSLGMDHRGSIASAAADTLVMCFPTGRLPLVSVTA
jgi:peptide-methionine (R)-S-oxide reductase